jgi:hypothetical protein
MKNKILVAILAGRGPKNRYDKDDFKTFHSNENQDVIAFYDENVHPNWKPKNVQLQHNGMPYTNTVSKVASLRNYILDYAENNGYKQLWMIDDDVRLFYHYKPFTKEDLEQKNKLEFTKFDPLPEIEHEFGGMLGGNFKRFKLATGKKYSNQMPVGCIYWDLEKIKNKIGSVPRFDTQVLLWDDYDYFLNFRKHGILPMTFNEYAFIKPETQDKKTEGKSIASAGMQKVCTMGFNLYKRYGSENCLCKKKLNILDVSPTLRKTFGPIKFRYRIDSLEHFLKDAYEDDNTLYVRCSDKFRKGCKVEWTVLFENIKDEPKKFKFGNV